MTPQKRRFVGERVRLGDVLETTFSGEWGTEDGETLTPILRTANFNEDGTFDYETPALRCIPEKKIAAKRMRRGDIVLEKSGGTPRRPVGIMAYYDSDGLALCSNFNQVLRVNKDAFIPKYAFHQLRWLREREAFEPFTRKTTGLQNLQMKKFVDLELLKPDLHVQSVVVKQFDVIAHQTVLLKQQIVKLDSLVKSRFVEMFGDPVSNTKNWQTRKLKSIGELKNGVNFKSVDNGYEVKCLGVGDFKDRYSINNMGLIGEVSLNGKPSDNQMLKDGDVVFVRSNGNKTLVGRCLAVFPGNEKLTFSGFCIRFRIESDDMNLDYFLNCMKSDSMRRAMAGRGANIQNLSQAILSKLVIPVPPLALQREFADFAASIDKSRFVDLGNARLRIVRIPQRQIDGLRYIFLRAMRFASASDGV